MQSCVDRAAGRLKLTTKCCWSPCRTIWMTALHWAEHWQTRSSAHFPRFKNRNDLILQASDGFAKLRAYAPGICSNFSTAVRFSNMLLQMSYLYLRLSTAIIELPIGFTTIKLCTANCIAQHANEMHEPNFLWPMQWFSWLKESFRSSLPTGMERWLRLRLSRVWMPSFQILQDSFVTITRSMHKCHEWSFRCHFYMDLSMKKCQKKLDTQMSGIKDPMSFLYMDFSVGMPKKARYPNARN